MEQNNAAQTDKKDSSKKRQLTIEEYKALQTQEAKKFKGFSLPAPVKIVLALPLLFIFLFGLIFIPWAAISTATTSQTSTAEKASKAK